LAEIAAFRRADRGVAPRCRAVPLRCQVVPPRCRGGALQSLDAPVRSPEGAPAEPGAG